MWSRSKQCTIWLLCLLNTGCGFEPLYSHKTAASGSQTLAGVKIDSIPGRMGQELKMQLEDGLNPGGKVPPSPVYRLSLTLTESTGAIGVSTDGSVARYNVYLDSSYTLYRTSDEKAITAGNLRHVSSYNNISNAYFSTFVSQADAEKRGISELAELYRQRLGAYLSEGAPAQLAAPPAPPGSETATPLKLPGQTNPPTTMVPAPPPPPAPLLLPSP